MLTAKISKRL